LRSRNGPSLTFSFCCSSQCVTPWVSFHKKCSTDLRGSASSMFGTNLQECKSGDRPSGTACSILSPNSKRQLKQIQMHPIRPPLLPFASYLDLTLF